MKAQSMLGNNNKPTKKGLIQMNLHNKVATSPCFKAVTVKTFQKRRSKVSTHSRLRRNKNNDVYEVADEVSSLDEATAQLIKSLQIQDKIDMVQGLNNK